MTASARLLRPASNFTPRSISGLALWLDASDSSTLFQNSDGTVPATATSDPVGYWGDKSGNARHATQATAGSRPTVAAASLNARSTVANNGTGSVALVTPAWNYTAGNTALAVFRASALNQAVYQRGSINDQPRIAVQNAPLTVRTTRGGTGNAQTHSDIGYAASEWSIVAGLTDTSLGQIYRNGVYGTATTDSQTFAGSHAVRFLSLPTNIYGLNGNIAEFIYYDRLLSAAEVSRLERYLAAKWGITLAPQVSNADANDWVNRVYANGGTVSASTAAAVNQFCNAIDAESGLRDRFYRLNLFAGTGLNACFVPLYRGTSLGGTQFGNTIDTNTGPFISGDYTETGASGGLTGNGTTKYLDTGLAPSNLPSYISAHNAVYHSQPSGGDQTRAWIGCRDTATASQIYLSNGIFSTSAVFGQYMASATANFNTGGSQTGAAGGFRVLSRTAVDRLDNYYNAVSQANSTLDISGGIAGVTSARPFFIFANNNQGTADSFINGRVMAYSLGLGLSQSQVDAYTAAMLALQTALGRNV